MTTKATPIVGGTPEGGVDGDIIVRDVGSPDGYIWTAGFGNPTEIRRINTAISVVEGINTATFPWGNDGDNAIQGTVGSTNFIKVAKKSATAGVAYPGVENDIILSLESNGAEQVHLLTSGTVNGRDMAADGNKLDTITSGAGANPQQIQAAEIPDAESIEALRSYSPKNITEIAAALDIGNYPRVTGEQLQDPSQFIDPASFSPSDIDSLINLKGVGEDNPVQINASQIEDPGAFSNLASYSPRDIQQLVGSLVTIKESPEYNISEGAQELTWSHGESRAPDNLEIQYICQVAERGYNPGDIVKGSTSSTNGDFTIYHNASVVGLVKNNYEMAINRRDTDGKSNVRMSPSSWRVKFVATWNNYPKVP